MWWIKKPSLPAAALGALLSLSACQRSDQSPGSPAGEPDGPPVQPEKLASSSAEQTGTNPSAETQPEVLDTGSVPGPLLPYAKGKGPKPKSAGSASEPAAPAPKALEIVAAPGEVKLISAGEEPRKKLRIAAKVGHKEKMEMTMAMNIAMELDGQKAQGGALPPMAMTLDLSVAEVREGGDLKYNFVLSKTDVPPVEGVKKEVVDLMKKGLGRLVGLKGHAVVTDRGITREAKIDVAADVDAQTKQIMQGMEQAMNQIGAPFPAEEVGVGGEWQHVTALSQNGVSLTQVANYKLVKMEDAQIVCDVVIQQQAPKQKVASPLGVTVDLLSLQSGGSGKTKLRFDRLSPLKSILTLDSIVTMGVPENGKVKLMKMSSKMQIKVEAPKK